jgi:nitrogen fixation NifU-like protein
VPDDKAGETGDNWVGELQNQVIRDMQKVYSPRVMELWNNPQNAGSLNYPDGYGQVTGPCGDTMQIWLRVKDNVIAEATFWTDGCGTSVVSASVVTIMARGKTLEQAARIDQQSVLNDLGGLPEDDRHCARLAADAPHEAIGNVRPGLARGKG